MGNLLALIFIIMAAEVKTKKKSMSSEEDRNAKQMEHLNKKRKLQNKVLQKIVEELNNQEQGVSEKRKK
jgi:hypothetical protein